MANATIPTRSIPHPGSPVTFRDPLPAKVDVVVVGGGVIGVASAYYLAKAGLSVLVCEKGVVAGEQSSRNWGWVRQQGRDPAELPVMMDSIRLWDGLAAETGEDLGFTRQGCLYLSPDEAGLERFGAWIETAKQHQLDSRLIGRAEINRMVSGAEGRWAGGLFTPGDGRAEPTKAVPALARAAQRLGVSVAETCAVRGLERSGGAISGVVTEQGRVACQAVVLAGGVWSSRFLAHLGVALPQLTVRSSVARTGPAPEIFAGNASSPGLCFRRRQDGGYTIALGDYSEHYVGPESFRYFRSFMPLLKASAKEVKLRFSGSLDRFTAKKTWREDVPGPFEATRVLDPAASPEAVRRMKARLAKVLPEVAKSGLVETWAGMIDATPDAVPVMDQVPGWSGLTLATGFSGHGFGIGPGAGRVVADLVQGKSSGHDLTRFRYARFFDGSPIVCGPM
ncbi:MAG: FAD-binding oxidoreductase [Rhodospirillales bacterium]